VVPKNLYLARQLFRKSMDKGVEVDPDLSQKASRMLEGSPSITDALVINTGDNPQQKIEAWYKKAIPKTQNFTLLQQ